MKNNYAIPLLLFFCACAQKSNLHAQDTLKVDFFTIGNQCPGVWVQFKDASTWPKVPSKFKWYFGDGDSASGQNASHMYQSGGTFQVKHVVVSNGETDSMIKNITILPKYVIDFSWEPLLPCRGDSIKFIFKKIWGRTDSTELNWQFGDLNSGEEDIEYHQYFTTTTRTYNVSLIVEGPGFCSTSVTHPVTVFENPQPTPKKYFLADTFASGRNIYMRFTPSVDSVKPKIEWGMTYKWWRYKYPSDTFYLGASSQFVMPIPSAPGFRIHMKAINMSGCTRQCFRDFGYYGPPPPPPTNTTSVIDHSVFNLYPNPSNGQFTLSSPFEKPMRAYLTDLKASIIKEFTVQNGANSLNLNMSPGIYFLRMENVTGTPIMVLISE